MSIKAVIFDLDGTLADTIPLTIHSLKEVTKELSGRVLSDQDILDEFGPSDTEIIKTLVDNQNKEESVERYVKYFSDNFNNHVKPMEGIVDLLNFLREKQLKVGIFTGRSLEVTQIVLDKLGIKDYFMEVLGADSVKNPKPDPEGINKMLEKLNVKSYESIYVGDFDVDILASKASGCKSVLALWSNTANQKFIELKPDKYFRSPFDFMKWLDETI